MFDEACGATLAAHCRPLTFGHLLAQVLSEGQRRRKGSYRRGGVGRHSLEKAFQ